MPRGAAGMQRHEKERRPLERASLLNLLLRHLQVIRHSSPTDCVIHKVCWTWLPRVVAGCGTVFGIASTVGVSERRHGHNQSHRQNQKYAPHCFSPPSSLRSSLRPMPHGGPSGLPKWVNSYRRFDLVPTVCPWPSLSELVLLGCSPTLVVVPCLVRDLSLTDTYPFYRTKKRVRITCASSQRRRESSMLQGTMCLYGQCAPAHKHDFGGLRRGGLPTCRAPSAGVARSRRPGVLHKPFKIVYRPEVGAAMAAIPEHPSR